MKRDKKFVNVKEDTGYFYNEDYKMKYDMLKIKYDWEVIRNDILQMQNEFIKDEYLDPELKLKLEDKIDKLEEELKKLKGV